MTEARTQSEIRAAAPTVGCVLWRNNSGACRDDTGRMIRYGLGNDSKKVNELWKSSDLIGITPVTVTSEMVGRTVGIFTGVEVKHPGWRGPSNAREEAQMRAIKTFRNYGGQADFATSVDDYYKILRGEILWR